MISGENLFSNLLTAAILLGLGLIVYLKMSSKTLVDFVKDIREMSSSTAEDAYDFVPNTFQGIR